VPNLAVKLQVGPRILGSESHMRKDTWRQQFESAPGYLKVIQ
jgi:hypothetical protein